MTVRLTLAASLLWILVPAAAHAQVGAAADPPTGAAAEPAPLSRRDAAVLTLSTTVGTVRRVRGRSAPNDASHGRLSSDTLASFRFASTPGRGLSWQIGAGSAGRQEQGVDEFLFLGSNVGGGLGFSLGRQTAVQMIGSFGYVPSFSLVTEPTDILDIGGNLANLSTLGQMPLAAVNFSVARRPAYNSGASLNLVRHVGARSTLTLTYGLRRTEYSSATDPSFKSWNAQARYSYKVGKYVGLRAGYGRRTGQYSLLAGPHTATIDDLDVGVDYSRPLSLSRNTTISFGSGSSMSREDHNRRWTLTGTAGLYHSLGRSGNLALRYQRGAHLLQGFVRPVFLDMVSASVNGGVSSRITLEASVTSSMGDVGTLAEKNWYRNSTGSGRVTFNVMKRAGVFAEYLYYQHDMGAAVDIVGVTPGTRGRQTGRAGFVLQVPVIREWVRPGERN